MGIYAYWLGSIPKEVLDHSAAEELTCFDLLFRSDKARLCLFGSSKNGFGFRDSDLDICMTLEGHENAEVRVLKLVTFTGLNLRSL